MLYIIITNNIMYEQDGLIEGIFGDVFILVKIKNARRLAM